jgi:hypothetical protein
VKYKTFYLVPDFFLQGGDAPWSHHLCLFREKQGTAELAD